MIYYASSTLLEDSAERPCCPKLLIQDSILFCLACAFLLVSNIYGGFPDAAWYENNKQGFLDPVIPDYILHLFI